MWRQQVASRYYCRSTGSTAGTTAVVPGAWYYRPWRLMPLYRRHSLECPYVTRGLDVVDRTLGACPVTRSSRHLTSHLFHSYISTTHSLRHGRPVCRARGGARAPPAPILWGLCKIFNFDHWCQPRFILCPPSSFHSHRAPMPFAHRRALFYSCVISRLVRLRAWGSEDNKIVILVAIRVG